MLGRKGICVIARTKCPENGDPAKGKFCPCWVEVLEQSAEDKHKMRTRTACSHTVMLDWMRDAVRGTWTGAAEVSAMRKDVLTRLNEVIPLEHIDASH